MDTRFYSGACGIAEFLVLGRSTFDSELAFEEGEKIARFDILR